MVSYRSSFNLKRCAAHIVQQSVTLRDFAPSSFDGTLLGEV
jgi:hypothetical protein